MSETKKQLIELENKREIFWTIVNAALLGGAVFLGAFIDGAISQPELLASLGAAGILFLKSISDYWNKEKSEYSKKGCVSLGKFL